MLAFTWFQGHPGRLVGSSILAALLLLEATVRYGFGHKPLSYARPYHPVYISGDYAGAVARTQLLSTSSSPGVYGYVPDLFGSFTWSGRGAGLSTSLSDFLFSHYLSRYPSQEVDRLTCTSPDSPAVYVLGGSLAVGTAASAANRTWHAIVENALQRELGRPDLHVFNGAMGGFVSFQERLAYFSGVVPRDGRVILIVNGYNDLMAPAGAAIRPGDPFHLGARFTQFYGSGLLLWLREHSGLIDLIVSRSNDRTIGRYREALNERGEFFRDYAELTSDLYLENMTGVLDDCAGRGAACVVGIQPCRALTASYLGIHGQETDILRTETIRVLYETLLRKVSASPYRDRFVDLTRIFTATSDLNRFTDVVHVDDVGQKTVAEAILPRVRQAMTQATARRKPTSARCRLVLEPGQLVSTVGLDRVRPANEKSSRELRSDRLQIQTGPEPWSYAAFIPLDADQHRSLQVLIRARVLEGKIGLGFLTDDKRNFVSETFLGPEASPAPVVIPIPPGGPARELVIRNGRPDGQKSRVEIERIEVRRPLGSGLLN